MRPCEGLPAGAGGALGKPRPVHRLDEKTGGLLVCAKTRVPKGSAVMFAGGTFGSVALHGLLCGGGMSQ